MYASVELAASHSKAAVLTIPTSAVLGSGARPVVLVELGEGRYQPREVRLGLRGDEYVQVLEGLADQERVVVSANFLIDAESNLKAALGSFGGHDGHGATAPSAATTPETPPAAATPPAPASPHQSH